MKHKIVCLGVIFAIIGLVVTVGGCPPNFKDIKTIHHYKIYHGGKYNVWKGKDLERGNHWNFNNKGGPPNGHITKNSDGTFNAEGYRGETATGKTAEEAVRNLGPSYEGEAKAVAKATKIDPELRSSLLPPLPIIPTNDPYISLPSLFAYILLAFLFIGVVVFILNKSPNKKYNLFKSMGVGALIMIVAIGAIPTVNSCAVKIGVKLGGISTNLSAQLLENLTDIKAVVYDPYLGELIFVGERNYSLPNVNLDDLFAALRVPKDQQDVSIEVDQNACEVVFGNTTLENSTMGYALFSADYLLKNKTLSNVSKCMCWERCGGNEVKRIWIYPSESILNVSDNVFVWHRFNVSISQEHLSGTPDNCTTGCWDSWENYLENNFMELSKTYEDEQ